jgi:acyl-coenzyme A thioesterase PaaI-like protein
MSDQPLDPDHFFGHENPCFGCNPRHPFGLRLSLWRDGESLYSRMTPGEDYQGPPGIVHGGLVMAIADETAAWALVGLRHRFGFTAAVEGRLARPVRIGTEVISRAQITAESSRVVKVAIEVAQNGVAAFTGTLTFMMMEVAAAERLLGVKLPELWHKLARSTPPSIG